MSSSGSRSDSGSGRGSGGGSRTVSDSDDSSGSESRSYNSSQGGSDLGSETASGDSRSDLSDTHGEEFGGDIGGLTSVDLVDPYATISEDSSPAYDLMMRRNSDQRFEIQVPFRRQGKRELSRRITESGNRMHGMANYYRKRLQAREQKRNAQEEQAIIDLQLQIVASRKGIRVEDCRITDLFVTSREQEERMARLYYVSVARREEREALMEQQRRKEVEDLQNLRKKALHETMRFRLKNNMDSRAAEQSVGLSTFRGLDFFERLKLDEDWRKKQRDYLVAASTLEWHEKRTQFRAKLLKSIKYYRENINSSSRVTEHHDPKWAENIHQYGQDFWNRMTAMRQKKKDEEVYEACKPLYDQQEKYQRLMEQGLYKPMRVFESLFKDSIARRYRRYYLVREAALAELAYDKSFAETFQERIRHSKRAWYERCNRSEARACEDLYKDATRRSFESGFQFNLIRKEEMAELKRMRAALVSKLQANMKSLSIPSGEDWWQQGDVEMVSKGMLKTKLWHTDGKHHEDWHRYGSCLTRRRLFPNVYEYLHSTERGFLKEGLERKYGGDPKASSCRQRPVWVRLHQEAHDKRAKREQIQLLGQMNFEQELQKKKADRLRYIRDRFKGNMKITENEELRNHPNCFLIRVHHEQHKREVAILKNRRDQDIDVLKTERYKYHERRIALRNRMKLLQKEQTQRQDYLEEQYRQLGLPIPSAQIPSNHELLKTIPEAEEYLKEGKQQELRGLLREARRKWKMEHLSLRPHRDRKLEDVARLVECESQKKQKFQGLGGGRFVKSVLHRDDPAQFAGITNHECDPSARAVTGFLNDVPKPESLHGSDFSNAGGRKKQPWYPAFSTRVYGRDGSPRGFDNPSGIHRERWDQMSLRPEPTEHVH